MLRYNCSRNLSILMIILIFLLSTSPTINATPTVEVNPSEPQPLATVTFTVTIPNVDDIQQVTIRVQECGNEPNIGYICYTDEFNEILSESASNTYTGSVTLAHENAIEIKYQVNYLTTNGWTTYPEEDLVKVDLDTSEQTESNTKDITNEIDSGSTENDEDAIEQKSTQPDSVHLIIGASLILIFIVIIILSSKRIQKVSKNNKDSEVFKERTNEKKFKLITKAMRDLKNGYPHLISDEIENLLRKGDEDSLDRAKKKT